MGILCHGAKGRVQRWTNSEEFEKICLSISTILCRKYDNCKVFEIQKWRKYAFQSLPPKGIDVHFVSNGAKILGRRLDKLMMTSATSSGVFNGTLKCLFRLRVLLLTFQSRFRLLAVSISWAYVELNTKWRPSQCGLFAGVVWRHAAPKCGVK